MLSAKHIGIDRATRYESGSNFKPTHYRPPRSVAKSGSSGYTRRTKWGSGMKKEYVKPKLAKREQLAKVTAIITNQSGNFDDS